jgi:hypothetical protein
MKDIYLSVSGPLKYKIRNTSIIFILIEPNGKQSKIIMG